MRSSRLIKSLLLVIPAVILLYLLWTRVDFSRLTNIEHLRSAILSFGALSPLAYILIMAAAIVISPIPSMPLAAASGMIWGPYLGTLYSLIGAEIGATISFLIARKLGRPVIERILHMDIGFCDKCTEKKIGWIIFFSRLIPFFQFDIVSYGAGLTKVRLRNFALATFFGMIPMTFIFAFFGKVLFIGNVLSIAVSLILITAIFIVPVLIRRYNIFGLRDRIES